MSSLSFPPQYGDVFTFVLIGRKVTVDPVTGDQIVGELRTLSFYRGRRYKAPKAIYDHLEDRGLIYH